jgi:hypothetical protein
MDYFETVVRQYLRSDPSVFVNTDFALVLNRTGEARHEHVRIDALAVDFEQRTVFLCEITSARNIGDLAERIMKLRNDWRGYCGALVREAHVPADWPVRLWAFVPAHAEKVVRSLAHGLPLSVTALEDIAPCKPSYGKTGKTARSSLALAVSLRPPALAG